MKPHLGQRFGHRFSAGALLAALFALTPAGAPAQTDPGGNANQPANFQEITPAMREAVEQGLRYLARSQQANGSYGSDRYGQHVGITALAGIAFMADGHLPRRGQYGQNVERALDFVLASASESGLIAANTSHGPMYGHGFATLFLGEVYGQTGDPRIRDVLLKAVRLIVRTQNDQGGWRYRPIPANADISVTICQVMALRSARNAGVKVPKETIERAVEYVKKCQNDADGGFRYMLSSSGDSAFPRSAAGVATLFYAGVYEGETLMRGLAYLMNNPGGPRSRHYYYYGRYYAAQATFLAGGKYWRQWFPKARDELLGRQQADGNWQSNFGDDYATAMALITLQVPNRLLPIFQR
jgi:squalene cyclase